MGPARKGACAAPFLGFLEGLFGIVHEDLARAFLVFALHALRKGIALVQILEPLLL
jgi:hypothetical protein